MLHIEVLADDGRHLSGKSLTWVRGNMKGSRKLRWQANWQQALVKISSIVKAKFDSRNVRQVIRQTINMVNVVVACIFHNFLLQIITQTFGCRLLIILRQTATSCLMAVQHFYFLMMHKNMQQAVAILRFVHVVCSKYLQFWNISVIRLVLLIQAYIFILLSWEFIIHAI